MQALAASLQIDSWEQWKWGLKLDVLTFRRFVNVETLGLKYYLNNPFNPNRRLAFFLEVVIERDFIHDFKVELGAVAKTQLLPVRL